MNRREFLAVPATALVGAAHAVRDAPKSPAPVTVREPSFVYNGVVLLSPGISLLGRRPPYVLRVSGHLDATEANRQHGNYGRGSVHTLVLIRHLLTQPGEPLVFIWAGRTYRFAGVPLVPCIFDLSWVPAAVLPEPDAYLVRVSGWECELPGEL